ncbi:helix-turn-helix domain-containing protein [Solibaculum mannosilyticum]|uniref:helix-turn-helix domain-containing protein n=1 Tax=Solibaculum mannosilyticum TaxID=2780922 RepID=UPI0007A80811|nr:Helix-turn-helix domain protein [Eubacteriaceae bacterium CHKCI005]
MDEKRMEEYDAEVEQFAQFVRDRITELRIKKDVSESRMSLELGNAKSYINNIISGRALPRMEQFLQICTYLDVTPEEFFNPNLHDPSLTKETSGMMGELDREELLGIQEIIRLLLKHKD